MNKIFAGIKKNISLFLAGMIVAVLALSSKAFAQGTGGTGSSTLDSLIQKIINLINLLIPILVGIAVIYFIWGIIKFMSAGGNEEKLREGKRHIVFGLLGLAIIMGVWGFVGIICQFFGITCTTP